MDQDFHYYGTYYAARVGGGYSRDDAALIAKAANFIDFLHEGEYAGYWRLVRDTVAKSKSDQYTTIAELTNPRYTFQAGLLSTGVSPEDGLWCSYHFTPGNYSDPQGAHSKRDVHGDDVARLLPSFVIRPVKERFDSQVRKLLNRPQSALSRALLYDAFRCATRADRREEILLRALGGWELLRGANKDDCMRRFNLILLGVRAHVIADTWAHQDWSGVDNDINSYFDIDSGYVGRQSIKYTDSTGEQKVVLSASSHENLQAVPNGTSKLGHGWMGHFPDYSFVKYEYKPRWLKRSSASLVRDNPEEYTHAFLELCSLFAKSKNRVFRPQAARDQLVAAKRAFSTPCKIADRSVCPRRFSSEQWMFHMRGIVEQPNVGDLIDAKKEPDPPAVLKGVLAKSKATGSTRYGTITVNAKSDLYLFQIAVDYHFHFVRHWLARHKILEFSGSWSQKLGPLPHLITDLFD